MKTLLLLLLTSLLHASPLSLHVATTGDDSANGSQTSPFATLERARDEIRRLKKSSPASLKNGAIVSIHGGIHERHETFLLEAQDSGSPTAPIIYQSPPKESAHLFSGKKISPNSWQALSKKAAARVHPKTKSKLLYQLDYAALGIENSDRLAKSEQSAGATESFVLFVNGKRQRLAQWPNHNEKITPKNDPGWATPNGTRDNESFYFDTGGKPTNGDHTNELDLDGTQRAKRWKQRMDSGHDLWLRGHWRTTWSPRLSLVREINLDQKWLKLTKVPPGGMGSKYSKNFTSYDGKTYRSGSGTERYYALNLLEEIDQPGEYAIDFQDRKVYFYPTDDLKNLQITLVDSAKPIIKATKTDHLSFDHLTFQGGLGTGLIFDHCKHLAIRGCLIDAIGENGIVINGGSHHLIQSNDLKEIGHSGITLNKIGDRKNLTPGNSVITNNHIHHTGQLHLDTGGIRVNEVIGLTISHNLIHHTPSRAYEHRNDNNVIFEYNEIHNCALQTSDTGATYGYGEWHTYGNIFRYNFIHHNKRANGFYCDDGDSGDFHYYNIIHQCIDALKFGGGHDNIGEHNLLIQNSQQRIDDRGISRNYRLGTRYEDRLRAFKPLEEPWKSYGQKLQKEHRLSTQLWTDVLNPEWQPEHPNGSRFVNNVTVESNNWRGPNKGTVLIENNVEVGPINTVGFRDYPKMDLRTQNSIILSKFPNLNTIFPKIGLRKDPYRTSIPSRESVGGLENFGETVAGEEDTDLDQN